MSADIITAIKEFYLLEELHALCLDKGNDYLAKAKLADDTMEVRERFNINLSNTLKDYLNIIIIGEGRHGRHLASPAFSFKVGRKNIFGAGKINRRASYDIVRKEAENIDPKSAIFQLLPAFLQRRWASGYGGKRWAEIAKVALLQFDTPREIFIDTVINLQHNTGTVLNKSTELFNLHSTEVLKDELNYRAKTKEPLYKLWIGSNLSYETRSLYRRAQGLGIVPDEGVPEGETFLEHRFEPSITWGKTFILLEDVKKRRSA